MDIPPTTSPCWLRLVDGKVPGFETTHVALKFLIKRLQGEGVPATAKARELHQFFVKFERLLSKEIGCLNGR